jgi:iron-sulfur cluster repair protein YtfE (RIC family)
MLTSTHTVTINPAFLQEIKEDSQEIRGLLSIADQLFELHGRTDAFSVRVLELLRRICDQLALHFSLEEAYGYFDDAIYVAPHLSQRAETLRGQHTRLYRLTCDLCESAEQLMYHESHHPRFTELSGRYREFRRELAEHESREADLILDALNCPEGTGD